MNGGKSKPRRTKNAPQAFSARPEDQTSNAAAAAIGGVLPGPTSPIRIDAHKSCPNMPTTTSLRVGNARRVFVPAAPTLVEEERN